jgi:intein-encoded DNA endonuclease-like protein
VTALLERRRQEGRSASRIRDELRDAHGITVSERTVQRWLSALAEPQPERAA